MITPDWELGNFTFLTAGGDDEEINGSVFRALRGKVFLSTEDAEIADVIQASLDQTGNPGFSLSPQEKAFLSKNARRTWCDYLIYRYKVRVLPRFYRAPSFPAYVLLGPASACNLRCTMCFQVDKTFGRKPYMGLMNIDLFKRLVDECVAGGTRALTLASRGEPLLHPQLPEMLRYASNKFFDFKLNTNATLLTEELTHEILQSDLSELVFSIDAHEKELYERIRVRGRFDVVIENVARFQKIRMKYPCSRLSTRVSGVRFLDAQDPQRFVSLWSQFVDAVGYVRIEDRWDTYNNPPQPEFKEPCGYLWERLYIWWDGTANPCDVDYKSYLSPASMTKESKTDLRTIWCSAEMERLRIEHAAGRRSGYRPCDRCGVC